MFELTPASVLAVWAAGLAVAAAVVSYWGIVGVGYRWLAGGVTVLFGVAAAAAGGGVFAWTGCALALVAIVAARSALPATVAFAASGVAFATASIVEGDDALLAISGALLLGAITAEMLLGHWYLVDPRLPRWALRRLDIAALAGLVLDAGVLVARGVLDWQGDDVFIGWAFVAMTIMTLLLIAGVWFSLREPSYTGVMAATGLSYLGVLTAIGSVVMGRVLLDSASGIPLL